MTSDKEILQIVSGLELEIFGDTPVKHNSYISKSSKDDESTVNLEIQKLLAKCVITKCEHETGEYISPVYKTKTRWFMWTRTTTEKLGGSCGLVVQLKNVNKDMRHVNFKTERLRSVLSIYTQGCYLALLDLRDAYYSVPIHPDHTKFLKFIWENQLHMFIVLLNSLCYKINETTHSYFKIR